MNKIKIVLCALLALVIIIPLAITIAPAAKADTEEPAAKADTAELQGGPGATLATFWPPYVYYEYYCKGTCQYYDWTGNKILKFTDGYLVFVCQDTNWYHELEVYCGAPWSPEPGQTPIGTLLPKDKILTQEERSQVLASRMAAGKNRPSTLPLEENITAPQMPMPSAICPDANGFVGCTLVDPTKYPYKCKNKPRLSAWYHTQDNLGWNFYTYNLNAKVTKVDKDLWTAEKIKGTLQGWFTNTPVAPFDNSPNWAQFEFKFNATPYL